MQQNENIAQIHQNGQTSKFKPADAWGRCMITSTVEGSKPVSLGKDFPMSNTGIVARSLINAEKQNQLDNPGAAPLQYQVTFSVGLTGLNDNKEDIVFGGVAPVVTEAKTVTTKPAKASKK